MEREGAPAAEVYVFVYGTLRSGGGRESLLADAGGRRVAETFVSGSLYDLGRYPALVRAGHGTVHGEVWACLPETVAALDTYEGVEEGLFTRVRVRAGMWSCWAYVAGPRLRRRLTPDRLVPSGRWEPRTAPGERIPPDR